MRQHAAETGPRKAPVQDCELHDAAGRQKLTLPLIWPCRGLLV